VARKIAATMPTLGANRFDLKYGMGGLSHEALMRNIELYGTQVIPRVRDLLSGDGVLVAGGHDEGFVGLGAAGHRRGGTAI